MLGPGKAEAGDHEFKVSLSYLSETLTWSSVSWKERERAGELCGVAIVYFPWDRGTRGQLSLCLQSWHLPWASVACATFVPIWFLHHILVWNVIVILYGYCFSLQLRLFQRLLSASVQTLFTISRQLESSARICKCCLHTQRQPDRGGEPSHRPSSPHCSPVHRSPVPWVLHWQILSASVLLQSLCVSLFLLPLKDLLPRTRKPKVPYVSLS